MAEKKQIVVVASLYVLPVTGVVHDVAINLDYNQHWGWSSPLEETLLMVEDRVLPL